MHRRYCSEQDLTTYNQPTYDTIGLKKHLPSINSQRVEEKNSVEKYFCNTYNNAQDVTCSIGSDENTGNSSNSGISQQDNPISVTTDNSYNSLSKESYDNLNSSVDFFHNHIKDNVFIGPKTTLSNYVSCPDNSFSHLSIPIGIIPSYSLKTNETPIFSNNKQIECTYLPKLYSTKSHTFNDPILKLEEFNGVFSQNENHKFNPFYPYFLKDPNFCRYQKRYKRARQPRTIFTKLQLIELNKFYENTTYLTSRERLEIAKKLGLTQIQVKTWFQNKRSKEKKLSNQNTSIK